MFLLVEFRGAFSRRFPSKLGHAWQGDHLCFEISSLPVDLHHVPGSTDCGGELWAVSRWSPGQGSSCARESHGTQAFLSSKFSHSSSLETGPLAPAAWLSWRVGCSSYKCIPPRPRGRPRPPPLPGSAACKPGGRPHVHAPGVFRDLIFAFFASVFCLLKKSPHDFCPLKFLIF